MARSLSLILGAGTQGSSIFVLATVFSPGVIAEMAVHIRGDNPRIDAERVTPP